MSTKKRTRSNRPSPIVKSVAYDPKTHIPLDEVSRRTGYEESYLAGSGAGRYGLVRFSTDKMPMFFSREEIDKLISAMNGNGSSTRLNGHRPRPAMRRQFRTSKPKRGVIASNDNGITVIPRTKIGGLTVVGSVDTIRQLLSDGFDVRFEVAEG
jgi:hypothetical protein